MATSESDDFESADEEMNHDVPARRNVQRRWNLPTTIDSESDDDTEFVPRVPTANTFYSRREKYCPPTNTIITEIRPDRDISNKDTRNTEKSELVNRTCESVNECITSDDTQQTEHVQTGTCSTRVEGKDSNVEVNINKDKVKVSLKESADKELCSERVTRKSNEKGKSHRQQKLGAKKLGTKIASGINVTDNADTVALNDDKGNIATTEDNTLLRTSSIKDEIYEAEMPEEMKSNKKFKEVFEPQGWEGLVNEIELPEELTEEKLQPILKKLSLAGQGMETSSAGWGWANWGVSSLINTASAGVSTLTSHVSHGLTLLEETMAITDEAKAITSGEEENHAADDDKKEQPKEQASFGFGNLISGVSSITKLVESTGSKVMSGGLDTLEAIGKKTMEVLQEGDPGLKKKRAFFVNETDKPHLSHILREAKEKAEVIEKTMEEKQKIRRVHFESLFDDYQGLVHLEALEMLSKQSNIKIQQHLINLDINELDSIQNMLGEVEELCELGEDDEDEDDVQEKDLKHRLQEKDLKHRLQEACSSLGINIAYEKLHDVCQESKTYTTSATNNDREIFEHAISVLAQFTALSVERFHKTAELLLIKEHRSTVNETDSLVQLTNILSKEIGVLANTYCSCLDASIETSDKPDSISTNITTIFMEASNASSYIQDAFKLLIPVIQVGAI